MKTAVDFGVTPFFQAEDAVRAVVDRLAVLDALLSDGTTRIEGDELRGIERIVSDTLADARKVRDAWEAQHG